MPRKQKSEATPKDAPKSLPKGRLNSGSKRVPITEPEQAPKRRPRRTPRPAPIAAPIVTPENQTLFIYSLPNWEEDRGESPHNYGNGGRALEQFHTYADAKQWLRDNGHYGHFFCVPHINGRLCKGSHFEIEPLEDETGDDGYSYLDSDDLDLRIRDFDSLTPDEIKLRIDNAKLRAQLEAASRNGSHNGFGELIEGVKFVEEIRRQAAPQKSLAEQLREVREVNEIINPRREVNPAPTPPPVDPKVEALKIVATNPNMIEIVKDVFGLKRESDSDPWADAFNKLLDHPQLPQIVQGAANIVVNGLSGIASMFAPKPAQTPAQQAPAPQQPASVQPPQQQAPPQVAPVETPALPANDQQPQATQPEQPQMLTPEEQALMVLMDSCARQIPPQIACGRLLQYADLLNEQAPLASIDDYLEMFAEMSVDTALAFVASRPGGAEVAAMPHAKQWCTDLQRLLRERLEEGDDFDQVTEIDTRKDEVKL